MKPIHKRLRVDPHLQVDSELRDKLSYRSVDVLQWCVYAVVVGILCGVIAVAFGMVIDAATEARKTYDWFVWLMPLAGVCIVAGDYYIDFLDWLVTLVMLYLALLIFHKLIRHDRLPFKLSRHVAIFDD